MAEEKQSGMDDIKRGNVGTGDQGPGDVSPNDKVGASTGQVAKGSGGDKKGRGEKKS